MISASRRRSQGEEGPMENYEGIVGVLAEELSRVENAFRGLSASDWSAPTKLVPVDPELPHWTLFELAGHFDIAIDLTNMLIDGREDSQPARDRTSFFINPRSETGPVVYTYAYTMVEGKTPEQMPDAWPRRSRRSSRAGRSVAADTARARLLRANAGRRVRRQPDRRGGRPRPGPGRSRWTAQDHRLPWPGSPRPQPSSMTCSPAARSEAARPT